MPTLDATPKGAAANAYADVAAANTYFDERAQATAWTGLSTDEKERALITATRFLEDERYKGTKTTKTQALKWPRADTFDDDGNEYDNDTVPVPVKKAMYELALVLVNDAEFLSASDELDRFERIKIAELEIEPRAGTAGSTDLPEIVCRILRGVLKGGGQAVLVRA